MKYFILALFIITYVLIIIFTKRKAVIAFASASIMSVACLIGKNITFAEIWNSIDFNVILMLFGIMLTVGLFSESKMPTKLAEKIISKVPNAMFAIVLFSVLSGFVSAFVDNVATVLMFAPIGLAVAKKIKISPVPVIISIAVSSNLQGAATLVGDTTSIMLGAFADMSFFDFFVLDGKLSIFWAVEIGALLTIPVLIIMFRKSNQKLCYKAEEVEVTTIMPTVLLLLTVLLLVVTSFLPDKPAITNGLICTGIGVFGTIYYLVKFKIKSVKHFAEYIDFETIFFLIFLFVIISAVEAVGIIDDIARIFVGIGSDNVFLLYTIIVFGSVAISAFVDNIPYVATMLPVIAELVKGLPSVNPYLLYFGLLCGATLGGNITPVGASANIVGIGILKKEGYTVKLSDFLKIGIPFTLIAVGGGYLFTWFVWGI